MDKAEREEAAKWLLLAEETYGEEGVSAVARALGLAPNPRATNGGAGEAWTATAGGATLNLETPLGSAGRIGHGNAPNAERSGWPAACPAVPPRGDPDWRAYEGDPWWFHCDYDGYQENRAPSPDWPIGECFYDETGALVDEGHPYGRCAGTPNSYPSFDPRHWIWADPGGIWRNFGSLGESVRQRYDRSRAWLRERGYEVPPSAPPKAPYPY